MLTVHVKILFHAMFKEIAGQREILQEVNPGFTLRDMLNVLAKKYGKEFNSVIDSKTGMVSLDTLVMLNGKSIRKPDVQLRDNDVVMITVPVGGG
ncbi:MAG: MoaD family protein [Candidatus Bathyarchaeota archaeon]|nr:MoaD family protein [Candidatus Bathyarchaeota archaeon]